VALRVPDFPSDEMQAIIILGVALLAALSHANPAIEREFHRVVNSNECLKACMKPVQESHEELSIFKRSNFTDYLMDLDKICTLISEARSCVDACGIASNPFALISVNAICTEKSRQDAEQLKPCLTKEGAQVYEQCNQICGGDYEKLNDDLHTKTSTMKPEQIVRQTNNVCVVAKCSARCQADNLNRRCGEQAGDKLASLVERILKLHRVDLEVFGLMDAVQKHTPPECAYLYVPEALFNPLKDAFAKNAIRRNAETPIEAPRQNAAPPMQQVDAQPQPDMRTLANQLYVRILKKQLQVLDKQLALLDKQEQKLEPTQQQEYEAPRAKLPRYQFVNDMF